jgi:hypothetical protein
MVFYHHIREVIVKFLQSFERSNIANTKKALKLIPTILNLSKGEIIRKSKAKFQNNYEMEFYAEYQKSKMYSEIAVLNVFLFLEESQCLSFDNDREVSYTSKNISKYSQIPIEQVLKANAMCWSGKKGEEFMMDPKKAVMSLNTNKKEENTAASSEMFNENYTASTNKDSTSSGINGLNNAKMPQLKRLPAP